MQDIPIKLHVIDNQTNFIKSKTKTYFSSPA